ncbi:MAG: GTPase Era [Neomegalonema sp.]|nr:GTPase Era [Neomegalonema sp.]
MSDQNQEDKATQCGFVALIGEPNAGKSTLLNRMVGAKVSIVTHKVQTTRTRIRGVAIHGSAQLIFIDTPGLFQPRRTLDRAMVSAAWTGAGDADVVVLMIEAHRGITEGVERIFDALPEKLHQAKIALAVNKIDMVKREKLLALLAQIQERVTFERVFLISAEKGDGVEDLRDWLAANAPDGPWHYPEDDLSDLPIRMLAAEITREKLILRLHQELPYQLTVETESWKDLKDGSARIEQVIYVARDGHKGIVLGHKGETIREIGKLAREDIAVLLERPVHLFLRVVVRPDWMGDPERYREMGLDISDGKK